MQHPVGTDIRDGDAVQRLAVLMAQQEAMLGQLGRTSEDHEKRIRFIERLITYASGAGMVLTWLLNHFKIL